MAAKKQKRTNKTKRPSISRTTRKFQLRNEHPIDQHVAEILDYSRSKRREVTVIRDGVRLLWALEKNDLSVLFEMFPHMKDQFLPGGVNLIEQIRAMMQSTAGPTNAIGQGSKPSLGFGTNNTIPLPIFEMDDEPTILINTNRSTNSAANFVNALKGLG